MKKITLDIFFKNIRPMAIHCDSKEQINRLLKEFDKYNHWFNYINYHKYEICQFYGNNLCICNDGTYDSYSNCKGSNIEVYEFEEVDFDEIKIDTNNIKNTILNKLEMNILKEIIDSCRNGRTIYNLTITRMKPLFEIGDSVCYQFELKFIDQTCLYQMSNYPNMKNLFGNMIINKEYTLDKLFPIEYIKVMEKAK